MSPPYFNHIHLDVVGGIAGDMFIAAILDLVPSLQDEVDNMLLISGLTEMVDIQRHDHSDGMLTGSRVGVAPVSAPAHHHRAWREIREMITSMDLSEGARSCAIDVFSRLADAEGRVHGKPTDEVSFHEVGAWDSIADVVVAGWLVDRLSPVTWSCSALPKGSGEVMTAHGPLPVPTPATTLLLAGMPLVDDGVSGERITPTGAAILAHLSPTFVGDGRVRILSGTGTGFGARELEGRSNILRVLGYGDQEESDWQEEMVGVCECEIDDQTSEDLAVALGHLRQLEGVYDVLQSTVYGKKMRMMTHIRVLFDPSVEKTVVGTCFSETTTLGLRVSNVRRQVLIRNPHSVTRDGQTFRIKETRRPGGTTSRKLEIDEIKDIEGGHSAREKLRRELENEDI